MALAFSITAAVMTTLFITGGAHVLRQARQVSEPRFGRLLRAIGLASIIMGMVGTFFLLTGLAHLRLENSPSVVRAMVFGFVVMFASFWLAIMSIRVAQDLAEPMRKAERMMGVLTSQIPAASVDDLGLTAREVEVVEVIAGGSISDAQIADKLFISRATAATHVRNILKKAELNNRRDLMLLGGWHDKAPGDRRAHVTHE